MPTEVQLWNSEQRGPRRAVEAGRKSRLLRPTATTWS
jgi:hypothetical protein